MASTLREKAEEYNRKSKTAAFRDAELENTLKIIEESSFSEDLKVQMAAMAISGRELVRNTDE